MNKLNDIEISNLRLRNIAGGALSYLPGYSSCIKKLKNSITSTSEDWGTSSPEYCYEVWTKHLVLLFENGMLKVPATMAELGPGSSLGVGLAAMLSGVDRYYALDVVTYKDIDYNLSLFDRLVEIFKANAFSRTEGWPDVLGYFDEHGHPSHILTPEKQDANLSDERVRKIRQCILNIGEDVDGMTIKYFVPWSDAEIIEKETVDLVLSHAVMEHVIDLESTYGALNDWLKRGGYMSHQIHFDSHDLSTKWNGHWGCSELAWKILTGKRPYVLNRQPFSKHVELIEHNDLNIITDLKRYDRRGLEKDDLSRRWSHLSDEERTCKDLLIQVRK